MKILFAHITQNLGGVEKRFFSYFQYLMNKADNEYTVLISKSVLHDIKKDIRTTKNLRIITYGRTWKNKNRLTRYIDYLYFTKAYLKLRSTSFDIVHYTTSASRIFRNMFSAKHRFISAVTSLKAWLYEEINSERFKEMVENEFGIDCLDTNIQTAIQNRYPTYKENIFVSPCSFISAEIPINQNLKEHAIAFVGRLIPEKGADILIHLLPKIIEDTTFKVYILGKGVLKNELEKIIDENDWNDRVELTYNEFPPQYLQKSEVFLSLQKDENYPSQSLLEAMYCKNSIIATNVGLTDKLVSNKNGFLIDDEEEILQSLVELERNDNLRRCMGNESYRLVTSEHTVERFHNYLMNIYKKVLEK